ncbi:unnamed protein product [Trichogramma brassicae]|uniref:Uncharacterized protein n=1 Tax=Trichogramma brassicae TaxID=86971 RepID=A0A6H5IIU3_9HYME|nr:unnamed protein product [Trichogramma brassicae]
MQRETERKETIREVLDQCTNDASQALPRCSTSSSPGSTMAAALASNPLKSNTVRANTKQYSNARSYTRECTARLGDARILMVVKKLAEFLIAGVTQNCVGTAISKCKDQWKKPSVLISCVLKSIKNCNLTNYLDYGYVALDEASRVVGKINLRDVHLGDGQFQAEFWVSRIGAPSDDPLARVLVKRTVVTHNAMSRRGAHKKRSTCSNQLRREAQKLESLHKHNGVFGWPSYAASRCICKYIFVSGGDHSVIIARAPHPSQLLLCCFCGLSWLYTRVLSLSTRSPSAEKGRGAGAKTNGCSARLASSRGSQRVGPLAGTRIQPRDRWISREKLEMSLSWCRFESVFGYRAPSARVLGLGCGARSLD